MKLRLQRAVAAFLLLTGLLFTLPGAPAGATGTIKIGFLYPFQGADAIYGRWASAGIDLRLNQAHYTIAGQKIELFKADENPTDPAATLLAAKTLVEQDGAHIIIGPVFSSDQEAVAAYFQQNDVTSVIEETCPWNEAKYRRFLCWPGTDVATTRALGDYAYHVLGYRKIATIGPGYIAGYDYINGAADEFKRDGGKILQQQWVPLTATDMGPYLSNVDQKADALLMWLLPSNEVSFLEEYRSEGLHIPILVEFDLSDPYIQQLGPALKGAIGLNFYEPGIQNAVNQQFVKAFTAAYPKLGPPSQVQEGNWTMTDALLRVLTKTHGDTSYSKVWPTFLKLRWNTPEGPACFTKNGIALTSQYITQVAVSKGTYYWRPIKSYPYQSDPHDTGKCSAA